MRVRDSRPALQWRALQILTPLFVVALILGLGSAASAQFTGPVPPADERLAEDSGGTSRGVALGTGSRASALGTSAVLYNAANLPLARVYHVESLFGYVAGESAYWLGAAVADSVSNRIAAGMTARRLFGGGARPYDGYDARMSLGMPLSQSIGIGVSGRYFKLTRANQNTGFRTRKGFTMDVSVRVTLTDGLHIAALGYNLINRHTSLAPTLLGGSAAYSISDRFSVGGDFLVDITTFDSPTYIAGGGIEILAGDSIPLRIGYRHDTGRRSGRMSGSVGYVDQTFGIDIAIAQPVTGPDTGTEILLSVRYQVQ